MNALAPYRLATEPVEDPRPEPATEPDENPKPQPPPLRSIHTSNFPAILQELGISLAVSTYQAGSM